MANTTADLFTCLCGPGHKGTEKWCFKTDGKVDKLKAFKFLCDSCCDTHLLSLAFVRMMNLESKIDRSVRRNIGTANEGVAFKTEGTIDLELEIRDVEGVWNTLCLTWHVADIGSKCLLNTTAPRKSEWKFVQQNNADGTDGTCLIAPDGKIFALGGDDHEMPILPTRQAPVVAKAKPSTLRQLAQQLLHIAKYGNKPKPPEPNNKKHRAAVAFETGMDDGEDSETDGEMPGLEDTSSEVSDSDDEWQAADEGDAACMASIADEIFGGTKTGPSVRTKSVVHTPASWHNLMHAGCVLSEATAKQSKAKFKINGKVKIGTELNASDLAALEAARSSCLACKQTKMAAPHATRTKGRAHASIDSTRSLAAASRYD